MFAQRGRAGEFRAGAIVAARFGAWSVVRPDEVLACDVATIETEPVVIVDTFRYAHDGLDIWLDCGSAWWIWRQVVSSGAFTWTTRGGPPDIRVK